jgi:hypothetical protein
MRPRVGVPLLTGFFRRKLSLNQQRSKIEYEIEFEFEDD